MNISASTLLIGVTIWTLVLCWHDWKSRKLPNLLTITGLAVVLAARYGLGGAPMFIDGFLAAAGAFLFLFFPFLMRAAGGGDVKMIAACGAVVGLKGLLFFLFATSAAGVVFAIAMVVCGRANTARIKHLLRSIFDFRYDRSVGKSALPERVEESVRVPFSIPITLGILSTLLLI